MPQAGDSRHLNASAPHLSVFKVRQDCDRYRCLHEKPVGVNVLEQLLHGRSFSGEWCPPDVYMGEPKLKLGDFVNAADNYLIANERATELLRPLFAGCGELLPLPFGGETYHVLNVSKCVDCLDDARTEWAMPDRPFRGWIVRHAFKAELLPDTAIFKIPEYSGREIFTIEGRGDRKMEFREIVRREKLKGLLFNEVWSSGAT